MSVELKSRLEASVGQILPSTLTFNYPTIAALADFFDREVVPASELKASAPDAPGSVPPTEAAELSEDELAYLLAQKLSQLK